MHPGNTNLGPLSDADKRDFERYAQRVEAEIGQEKADQLRAKGPVTFTEREDVTVNLAGEGMMMVTARVSHIGRQKLVLRPVDFNPAEMVQLNQIIAIKGQQFYVSDFNRRRMTVHLLR